MGVVGNAIQSALGPNPGADLLFSVQADAVGPSIDRGSNIRASVTLESTFRQAVTSLDKEVPLDRIEMLDATFASEVAGPRLQVCC